MVCLRIEGGARGVGMRVCMYGYVVYENRRRRVTEPRRRFARGAPPVRLHKLHTQAN